MNVVRTFKFAHRLAGVVAFIFVAGYVDPSGHRHGEIHLLFTGIDTTLKSGSIGLVQQSLESDALQFGETEMAVLAEEAKRHLVEYVDNLPWLQKSMLKPVTLSTAKPQEILQAWLRRSIPHLSQVAYMTKSEDLRAFVQSFTKCQQVPIKRPSLSSP